MCIRTHIRYNNISLPIWYYVCWFYWLTFTRNETTDVLRQWPIYIYIYVGERHVRFYYTHLFGVRCGDDNLISLSRPFNPNITTTDPWFFARFNLLFLPSVPTLIFCRIIGIIWHVIKNIYFNRIITHGLTTNFLKRITIKWIALT